MYLQLQASVGAYIRLAIFIIRLSKLHVGTNSPHVCSSPSFSWSWGDGLELLQSSWKKKKVYTFSQVLQICSTIVNQAKETMKNFQQYNSYRVAGSSYQGSRTLPTGSTNYKHWTLHTLSLELGIWHLHVYVATAAHTSFKFGSCTGYYYTCRCVMMDFIWNKVDRKLKGQQGHDYCIIRAHQPNTIQLLLKWLLWLNWGLCMLVRTPTTQPHTQKDYTGVSVNIPYVHVRIMYTCTCTLHMCTCIHIHPCSWSHNIHVRTLYLSKINVKVLSCSCSYEMMKILFVDNCSQETYVHVSCQSFE